MELGRHQSFLVVYRSNSSPNHRVKIVTSQSQAFKGWVSTTRISPIFGVVEFGTARPAATTFRGENNLIFLGPLNPAKLRDCFKGPGRVWISLGLYNVIVNPRDGNETETILSWARKEGILYECWKLQDGVITEFKDWGPKSERGSWRAALARLSEKPRAIQLEEAIKEYCPIMAVSMSRSEKLGNGLLSHLEAVNDFVRRLLLRLDGPDTRESVYRILGQIITVNNGLSRFASQAFAGATPIIETDSHLKSNSLLGIGVAALGLYKLRAFFQSTLGDARIPERFAMLERITDGFPSLDKLKGNDEFWFKDHLKGLKPAEKDLKPIIPLVSFFSSRDGYKSTLTTVSAPLAAIYSCNSLQWSLMTLTHEISHIFIRSIMTRLFPNLESDESIRESLLLLNRSLSPRNLLEEIKRLLLITIEGMEQNASGIEGQKHKHNEETLRHLLEHWHHEVEEILVHVFDYLYFYGMDADRYIRGIWVSWGTIPNINIRVHEYVVRSICALLAKHLRKGRDAENLACRQVRTNLQYLLDNDLGGEYVSKAIRYIDRHWDDEIRYRVVARKNLVKVVKSFLFSEEIATLLRGEPEIRGGTDKDKEGYALKPYVIGLNMIRNPLIFLEVFTTPKSPSAAESAWMHHILAFCVYGND